MKNYVDVIGINVSKLTIDAIIHNRSVQNFIAIYLGRKRYVSENALDCI